MFHKDDKTTHNQPSYYGLFEILEADKANQKLRSFFCGTISKFILLTYGQCIYKG